MPKNLFFALKFPYTPKILWLDTCLVNRLSCHQVSVVMPVWASSISQSISHFIPGKFDPQKKNKSNKKLSYRRETARQLPTWRGARPSSPLPLRPSGYSYACGRIRKPQRSYVKRAVRKAHFKLNRHSRSFKVILICAGRNPERCIVVMCN